MFRVVAQKKQARGDKQCGTTSLFLLHLLWGVGHTECRATQTSCDESEITFHAPNELITGFAILLQRIAPQAHPPVFGVVIGLFLVSERCWRGEKV